MSKVISNGMLLQEALLQESLSIQNSAYIEKNGGRLSRKYPNWNEFVYADNSANRFYQNVDGVGLDKFLCEEIRKDK